jgi:peptidoglycan/xylan/chitin deacetylase (PgdA/CDA1 family)
MKMDKIYSCFPQGKYKVLTLSYDDGKQEDRRLLELLNQYQMKGTFHLNFGLMHQSVRINPEEIKKLYQGHEVAAHTMTHPTIGRIPTTMMIQEILKDREGLESLVGYPVRGFSYPNGSYNDELMALLPSLGIRYARIVGDSENFNLPSNSYEWKATCHHNHKLLELGEIFLEAKKSQYLYMMYVWGHSYEFARDNNWELMEEFCQLTANREEIWYATNIEIMDYLDAVSRLQYTATCNLVHNPCSISTWITVNDVPIEIQGGETKRLF